MVLKRSVVILLIIISIIVGYELWRAKSGSFNVIRNINNTPQSSTDIEKIDLY